MSWTTGFPGVSPWLRASPWSSPWSSPWATLCMEAADYALDSWQRGILFLDVLRQRGDQYHEQQRLAAPNVLSFEGDVVLSGRDLPRPVNYRLIRIRPPEGLETNPRKRPFVIVDPRAGHGPGIAGFKADSEIGVALRAGHPCYFVGFLPRPEPGQTVEDVMRAEQAFVAHAAAAHPEAEGKPVVIGNCQAGWQVMMAAATRPEVFGPLIVAGAPLSYWAGWRGMNPMRYTGGLLGGTWMTALAGDLGDGLFDGAWLVQNFENLDLANTWWTKQYTVYDRIDTEPPRYLAFEKWWNGHILTNAGEMQYITDNLFVGNKLSTAELTTSDKIRIDLREIRSPIVVFCSRGDNITPPPQALGWILDLYDSVDDIRAHGQTIVYTVHESIGHLGIFVSGKVARREHEEFASNIDFIDVLPPGLYEAEILDAEGAEGGEYVLRFAGRSLDDIRAIVQPRPEDDRRFATVAWLSEANLGLYRHLLQPLVRALVTPQLAETIRSLQPLRLQYNSFSSRNPWLAPVTALAGPVRQERRPAAEDNLFRRLEHLASAQIVAALDRYGEWRDAGYEAAFLALYSHPVLQSLAGLMARDMPPRRQPGAEPELRDFLERRMAELRAGIAEGGAYEACLRALIYIGLADRVADARSFAMLRNLRREEGQEMSLAAFKAALREQFFMLRLDRPAALAALPRLLRNSTAAEIEELIAEIHRVEEAAPLSEAARQRHAEIEAILRQVLAGAPRAGEPEPPAEAPPARIEPAAPSRRQARLRARDRKGSGR